MSTETPASSVSAGTAQRTLDELITRATIEDHQSALEAIAQISDPIVQDSHVGKITKQLGVNRTAVIAKLKTVSAAVADTQNGIFDTTAMRAMIPGLVDLVRDDAGNIRYLMKEGGTMSLADSWQDQDGTTYTPPGAKYLKYEVPSATNVMNHYRDNDDNALYQEILAFFKRFSYLDDDVWPIIVLFVFLSYLQDHQDVRYIPVIYFYAVAERGKSRTAKTILALSYRGLHLVDIRPANIVRFSQNLGATIFFDVTDLWKSADKNDGQDILLGRYEKGCQVVRVLNADKGPFADQTFFDVYGSTIVATNEPANITFESRCLTITMPNRPGEYENLSPEMALSLKERLTAWRARMMGTRLPHAAPIPGISGRLRDISKPLFQLAQLVAPEAVEPMKRVLLEMAGQKIEDKKESLEGRIVAAIYSKAQFDGGVECQIPVEAVRTLLNAGKPEQYHISSQKLGKRIKSLSINTRDWDGRSQIFITAKELDVLLEQYGLKPAETVVSHENNLQHPTTPAVPLGFTGSANRVADTGAVADTSNPSLEEVVGSGSQSQNPEQRPRVGWKK